jgi:glycosyltransferase involved in cell wall biosynthesis
MPRVPDILVVALGGTAGLRASDDALVLSMRRAGASVALARVATAREPRTFALTDLAWAVPARRAAAHALREARPRAIVYATTTAALLWPEPGAIRFDSPAAANRPGRHGVWQRPVERRRFAATPLLLPTSDGALAAAPAPHGPAIVVPIPVAPSGPPSPERDLAAITYAANPEKKGLDRVLAAWRAARREGEALVVAGLAGADEDGIRYTGMIPAAEYRALLRRARVFVTAPRWEDYGLAQLEALADGCVLVTNEGPGPYAALPLARELDPRLVGDGLADAVRVALDDPVDGYAERAAALLAPFAPGAVDRVVAERVLPALLGVSGNAGERQQQH